MNAGPVDSAFLTILWKCCSQPLLKSWEQGCLRQFLLFRRSFRFVVWWSRYETFYTLARRNTYYHWANDPYRYKTPWIRGVRYVIDTDLPRPGPSWTRLLKVRVSQLGRSFRDERMDIFLTRRLFGGRRGRATSRARDGLTTLTTTIRLGLFLLWFPPHPTDGPTEGWLFRVLVVSCCVHLFDFSVATHVSWTIVRSNERSNKKLK